MKKLIVRAVILLLAASTVVCCLPYRAAAVLPGIPAPHAPSGDQEPSGDAPTYSVGDVIELGSYPQSRCSAPDSIPELEFVSYGYLYCGEPSNIMMYADVECGGERYRAVSIRSYRPVSNLANAGFSYEYQRMNGYRSQNLYWFKYEPLRWRVLDPETGLVLCESIIDSQSFTDDHVLKPLSPGQPPHEYCYTDDTYRFFANDYAMADIRGWLDGAFYDTAFNSSEQTLIRKMDRPNPYPDSPGDYGWTSDKVFLMSLFEMTDPACGFSEGSGADPARTAQGTEYAKAQGLYVVDENEPDVDHTTYYLRTAAGTGDGYQTNRALGVSSDGSFCETGVIMTSYGIRPAMNIDLDRLPYVSCNHRFRSSVTAPTCTEYGCTTYVCSICGDSYSDNYTSPSGHSVKTVVKEPTCTEAGSITTVCRICLEVTSEVAAPLGHVFTSGYVFTVQPTQTVPGCKVVDCSRCGERVAEKEVPFLRGDVNGDTAINMHDISALKGYIAGITGYGSVSIAGSDVNGDGAVNFLDLSALKRHLAV